MSGKQFTENLYQVFEKDGMQTALIYFDQSTPDWKKNALSFFEKLTSKIPKEQNAYVKTEKLEKKPVTSFEKALQGNIAGIQVNASSGQPGANTEIRIRGTGSINAGNEPLYVIDGVPVISGDLAQRQYTTNALSSFDPDDFKARNL